MARFYTAGMAMDGCRVRAAVWPVDLQLARGLLRNYEAHLLAHPGGAANISLQAFHRELAELDRRWGPPGAVLLLAMIGNGTYGCAAVRLLEDRPGAAELKRMWVEPQARGAGCGRALGVAAIAWAEDQGATELLLDTVPAAMPEANRLYQALGFERFVRYHDTEVADLVFFRRALGQH